ncbi:PaaI family thioesterase [Sphingobium sp.]|uniref:PaaI family thioesterase n=1 Tax=Sphingobium sp. TaxID=1912891 RepID=UPI003BB6349F
MVAMDLEDEPYRFGFTVEERHCNRMRVCHGGMLSTLADIGMGVNANTLSDFNDPTPTISLSVDFIAAAAVGDWIETRTSVLRITRSLCFVEGRLIGPRGAVARCNATFKRRNATASAA